MSVLEISQIIFNLIISITAVIITVAVSMLTYKIIKCIEAVKNFFSGASMETSKVFSKINKFLESIFTLSFLSNIFNKKNKNYGKK